MNTLATGVSGKKKTGGSIVVQNNFTVLVILLFSVFAIVVVPAGCSVPPPPPAAVPVWSDSPGTASWILVDCSRNCSYIAAATHNGNVIRLYSRTGTILWTYRADSNVRDVKIAGDGETVVAGIFGGDILCFNRTGTRLWKYSMRSESLPLVAISDDGSRVFASGGSDLYFFDRNGTLLSRYRESGSIWAVALSGDGTLGTAGSNFHKFELLALHPNGTLVLDYPSGPYSNSVAVSQDGSVIVAEDYKTVYYFGENRSLLWNFTRHATYTQVAVSADGEYVASGSQYYLRYFNRTGDLLWTHKDSGIVKVAVTGSGDMVFAGGSGGLYLFDRTGHALWRYNQSAATVSAAQNGEYFAAGTASEVLFFNRDGSATPPPDPVDTPESVTTTVPAPTETLPTAASPVSGPGILAATGCACGIIFFRKRRGR